MASTANLRLMPQTSLTRRPALRWAAVPALLWLAALATYSGYADGPARAYVSALLLGGLCAAAAGIAVWLERPGRPAAPLAAAAIALLPFVLPHAVRLAGTRLAPREVRRETTTFTQTEWPLTSGGTSTGVTDVAIGRNVLTLPSAGGRSAWTEWLVPLVGDARRPTWWLPRAYHEAMAECVLWDGAVDGAGPYFILADFGFSAEWGTLLIEMTPAGTQAVHSSRSGVTRDVLPLAAVAPGAAQRWQLAVQNGWASLRVDGTERWSKPGAQRLRYVRFGDTRPDPLHAGTLTLRSPTYVRRHGPGAVC